MDSRQLMAEFVQSVREMEELQAQADQLAAQLVALRRQQALMDQQQGQRRQTPINTSRGA